MGAAIQAVGDSGKILRHNPVIFLIGGIAWFVFSAINFVFGLIPLLGNLLSFFIYPLFIAGLFGIIYAGRNGNAGVDDFAGGIGGSYLRLLGGYTLIALPLVVLSIAFVLLSFFFLSVSPQRPRAVGGTGLIFVFAFIVLVGVGMLLFQFFNVAIVAGDGVVQSFRTSMSMVLTAPFSALGFTLIKLLMGAVILGVPWFVMFSVLSTDASVTAPTAAGLTLILALLGYVFAALPLWRILTSTYHVAYFNRRQTQAA